MAESWELLTILERILNGNASESDTNQLRQYLTVSNGRDVVQLGKYNVNIGNGKDIHIGDKVYQGTDAQTIRTTLLEVLSQNTQQIEIDWRSISQTMLLEQQRLTTNPLTSSEGISYRTEQVYVPLGLVERKKQTRRREDVPPEQGSELYKEVEITQTFEHQQFLQQVLKQRQSPRSQGRRIAIIGEPGAGKTTLLQQIAQWISAQMAHSVVIWVSLADLGGRELESYLLNVWLQALVRNVGKAQVSSQVQDDLVSLFNQGLVWLLLDGADEMQAPTGNALQEIERQIRTGSLLQQARIVLSCRLNLWDGGSNTLDSFDNYRTLEFSYPQQVEQFIGNWFRCLPSTEIETGQRLCAALKEQGKERIRDLAKNPLRLTLLCFKWYLGEGNLPQTKAGLYEQFVADFYEWKKGQFVTTGEQRKQLNAALGELARQAIDKEATRFRLRQDFVCQYLGEPDDAGSLFGLALRLGWLNKVGVDGENPRKGVYAFFHPTFQEYFAALAINNWHYFLNHIPENPSHPDASYRIFELQWKEVFLMWLGLPEFSPLDKEKFMWSILSFDDNTQGFYWTRAIFLVTEGLSEFRTFSAADTVYELIIRYAFGFEIKEQKWCLSSYYFGNFNEDAKEIIIRANSQKMIQALEKLLIIIDLLEPEIDSEKSNFKLSNFFREEVLKCLGKLDSTNPLLPQIWCKIINTTEYDSHISLTIGKLQTIDIFSHQLVDVLIQLFEFRNERELCLEVIRGLSKVGIGSNKAILFLEELLDKSQDIDILREAAESLGIINCNKSKAIKTLINLLKTNYKDFFPRKVAKSLVSIGRNQETIDSLTNILDTNNDERTLREAAEALGNIDYGNYKVSRTLLNILINTSSDVIILRVAETFIELGIHKLEAIKALTFLIENSKEKVIPIHAAWFLAKIDTDNQKAIEILVREIRKNCDPFCITALGDISVYKLRTLPIQALEFVLESSKDSFKERLFEQDLSDLYLRKIWAAKSIGKIELNNDKAVKNLLEFIKTAFNDVLIESSSESLIQILEANSYPEAIVNLKPYINTQTYENNPKRYRACFKVIWYCAKNMTYPEFYMMWNS